MKRAEQRFPDRAGERRVGAPLSDKMTAHPRNHDARHGVGFGVSIRPERPGGMGEPMAEDPRRELGQVSIGSIVIRCCEYQRMVAFWQAALGYEIRHADPNGGFVILRDPLGKGPNVSLDQAPEPRTGRRGWLHLDLYTRRQADEVARLVALGAGGYPWRYPAGADYVVLEDPDGNLFCVVQVPEPDQHSSV